VLFKLFGRDRVHVAFAEDFFGEPEPCYDAIVDFLGLSRWRPSAFERHNARPGSPLSPELQARLSDHFAPHDEKLAALLGEVPPWRR
jgi:hypothetical protein